ncbi:MAG: hypothetical protein FWE29_04375 [Defluviitaleaceae bacterium]|nr:hypothetical protein [Defluviitaleaceae bacterium]
MKKIIVNEMLKYPKSKALDILKLIYQNEFGCGHLVKDESYCLQMLEDELKTVTESADALFEPIGNGYSRLNLSAAKKAKIPASLIARLFYLSANRCDGEAKGFLENVKQLKILCEQNELPFSMPEIESFINEWTKSGCKPFSHSDKYRESYNPAYRVILSKYENIIMPMSDIVNKSSNKNIVVAIDGRCGSGKTTLAAEMKEVLKCNVINIDDFFLPPNLRTEKRLNEPGGNIHYERFTDEVIKGLKSGKPFEYGVFDCREMSIVKTEVVKPSTVTIVEGAYSLNPHFGDIYDLKIFCDIDPDLQKTRIINRDGVEMYKDFESKWIPMEEVYFKAFNINDKCDYVIKANQELKNKFLSLRA